MNRITNTISLLALLLACCEDHRPPVIQACTPSRIDSVISFSSGYPFYLDGYCIDSTNAIFLRSDPYNMGGSEGVFEYGHFNSAYHSDSFIAPFHSFLKFFEEPQKNSIAKFPSNLRCLNGGALYAIAPKGKSIVAFGNFNVWEISTQNRSISKIFDISLQQYWIDSTDIESTPYYSFILPKDIQLQGDTMTLFFKASDSIGNLFSINIYHNTILPVRLGDFCLTMQFNNEDEINLGECHY